MGKELENWLPIANDLGFTTEFEMLDNLYNEQNFSLNELSSILGPSTAAIRYRLMLNKISLRPRGGPRCKAGKRRLKHVPSSELDVLRATTIAERYQVHISTVYAERQLRKKGKGKTIDEILSNNTNLSLRRLRDLQHKLDGASAVDASEGVQGVLPEEVGERGDGDS